MSSFRHRHRLFTGTAKKGLVPASRLHFRCDDGAGDTLTDDVVGATIVRGVGEIDWSVPNAASNRSPMPSSAKIPITNVGTWLEAQTNLNTGSLLFYVTLAHELNIGTVHAGLVDLTGTVLKEGGGYFIEPNTATPNDAFSMKGFDYFGGVNPDSEIDFVTSDDTLLTHGDIGDGEILSYCMCVNFGKAPAFTYADHKGRIIQLDQRTLDTTEPFIVDHWRMYGDGVDPAYGALQSVFHGCDLYTEGMLYFEDSPSTTDMIECAKWHHAHAPNGNKDVWQGWNTYKAGT